MTKCTITVDEGADTAVYHTDDIPAYKAQPVPAMIEGEPDGRLVFCVFVPKNGHNKGKLMYVPFSRVVSVAEEL